jgi:hypothetical protein
MPARALRQREQSPLLRQADRHLGTGYEKEAASLEPDGSDHG